MNGGPFGDQLGWLRADLTKAVANRKTVPWIFVSGHRPFYSSSPSGTSPESRQYFEPLFNEFDVDVIFWGHIHWYERFFPVAPGGIKAQDDYMNPGVPVYMLPAAPGNVEGLTQGDITNNYTAFLSNDRNGLGLMTIINHTVIEWNYYESDNQALLDTMTIVKSSRYEKLLKGEDRWAELKASTL